MRVPFLNRSDELGQLSAHWASGRAELLVAIGRRRVGKSRILDHFFGDKRSITIVGTLQRPRVQLADATREIFRVTQDPVLEHQDFDSWEALLAYVGEKARKERLGFVIDEFSYYCDESPELPSVLQRWWDRTGSQTHAMIVLAGSHVAFMEKLVLGGQALYGRRTGELRLQPFDYANAGRFFPAYSPEDRVRAYGVFGGMPAYLAAGDSGSSLAENIARVILSEDAYLRREPEYLLSQERSVNRPLGYLAVLRAIADGQTTPSDIASAAGFRSAADVTPILERLREFRLVDRIIPMHKPPTRVRISRYIIVDPFLAFWFRFVPPSEAALEQGAGSWVLQNRILPNLDWFISRPQGPWERACQDYLWRAFRAGKLADVGFDRLGPWWEGRGASDSAEIDLLAMDGERVVLAGSCKWRNEYAKPGDLDALKLAAARAGATEATRYVVFSRSGFDPSLIARAAVENALLVTPADMYADDIVDVHER
jgi:AAA+ ATPase superfamily predicted ATPase